METEQQKDQTNTQLKSLHFNEPSISDLSQELINSTIPLYQLQFQYFYYASYSPEEQGVERKSKGIKVRIKVTSYLIPWELSMMSP